MSILDRYQSRWGLGRVGGRRGGQRRRPRGVVGLEILEVRVVPSTSTWTGLDAATSTNWSDANNWLGDIAPAAGDDLIFPSGASSLASNNDIGAGVAYGALTIADTGYSITGNAVSFTSIDASQTSGSSEVDLPIALSGAVSVDTAGAKLVLGGVISGSAGLTKNGAGALDLTAANTYTGTTAISAGVLQIDGAQAGSPVTVASGATLGGIGTVGSITATAGTVSPGDSAAGVLIDAGAFDLGQDGSANNSTYSVVIDGSTPGTGTDHYSQTQVAGAINLTGATLDVTLGPDFTPSVPTAFTIIDNTGSLGVAGTFDGLAQGSTIDVDGNTFQIDYNGGTSGKSVVLTEVFPSATSLLAAPTTAVFGQPVTLTATVGGPLNDPAPTGTVEFFNGTNLLGTETLSSRTATLDNALLPVATNSITAQYEGDSNYGTSTSPATPVMVSIASTSASVTASPASPIVGQPVTFTATVAAVSPSTATPTGTVDFMNGSTQLGTGALTNGVATFPTSTLTAGDYTITADYVPTSNFAASTSSPLPLTVAAAATSATTVTASTTTPVFGQGVTFTMTVAPISPATGTPTGTVELLSGTSVLNTATLVNGVATIETSSLAPGNYSITAAYSGDSSFTTSTSSPVTVAVGQATSATVFTSFPLSPVVRQSVTLTATVAVVSPGAGTPTGTIQFLNGTTPLGTATITAGVATLVTTALPSGANTVTAKYSGDADFAVSTSPAVTVTVAAIATSTTTVTSSPSAPFFGQSATLTATVAPVSPLTGTPTGSVEFFNGTTLLGTGTLTNGVGTFSTTTLPVASNSITAQYSGDSNFTSSTSSPVTVPVGLAASSTVLTSFPLSPVVGQSVTLTATVSAASPGSATPTGNVQFFNGTTSLGTATLAGGVATISTSTLAAGANSITAQYLGDSNFNGDTSPIVTVTLAPAATSTTTLNVSTGSSSYGQSVLLSATVSSTTTGTPTGTVQFFSGTTSLGSGTLTDGVATLASTALPIGANSVTAQYSGDSTFTSSTSPVATVTVGKASTTTALTLTTSTPVFGQSVTLTATITTATTGSASPTGTVTFLNGTTALGTGTVTNGVATLTTTLPVGTYSITADYPGDANYATSTSTPPVSVKASEASTTTVVVAFPTSPVALQSVTLTATVTVVSPGVGTPTGTIQFFNGTTSLGAPATITAGVATLVTTSLPAGTNTITADYVSDGNFAASTSSPLPLPVAAAATSTTTVTASTNSPVFGQDVTFTMTVAPISPATGTPTGTVNLMNGTTLIDTATLSGGVATFDTSSLAIGSNTITGVYSGDASFTSSTSTPLTVTVAQAASSTLVTFFPVSPIAGQTVTLTATVSATSPGSGTPTGTVQFFNGTTPLGTGTLAGGVATFAATTLATGGNLIAAQYLGDNNFIGDTSPIVTVTLAATPTSTTSLTFSPSSPLYGQDVTLTATVASTTTGTPTGTVEFFNGTTSLGTATLTGGVASLPPTALPTGANAITAQYSGDTTFTSSNSPVTTVTVGKATTTTTVTFTPSTPVFGQTVTLTATITPTTTGSASPTGTVTFLSGSTTLGTETLTNGVATLAATTLAVGANSITADYQGDTNYATSTSAAVSVPVSQSSTTTAVTFFPSSPVGGQNVTLTASVAAVSPGLGTPTGTVEFFSGTTPLGTATITAGVANLVTTAIPTGDNSITAQYSGDTNFAVSTSPAVTVTVAATATSTTTLTFSPSAPVFGNNVTLTATVAPVSPLTGTPSGSVEFFNGTTLLGTGALVNGVGTFSTTTLPVAANAITAQYSGDNNFTSSTSSVVTVTVNEISTTTTLTFTPSSPAYGASVTFTATITPASVGSAAPSGTVNFFNGSTMIGSGTVTNNVATFITTALPVGTSSITATYVGDSNYTGSTSTPATVVTIAQETTTTTVTFSPTLPVTGQVVTLTATITPSATGATAPTGTVNFFNGSTLLGSGTVSNDVATLDTTGLTVGNNAVTAQYLGDSNYTGSTSAVNSIAVVLAATTTTVSSSNTSPASSASVTLSAIVAVNSPGAGTATGTVEFFANGTSIGTATLNNGKAALSVVLPTAVNSITAQYSGSPDLQTSTSTPITVTVGTPNEQWLSAVYLLEVGRAPTQAELTRGINQLAKGVSRNKVVNGIANSPEATAFLVQSNYELYLGVQPTSKQVRNTLKEARRTHTSVLAVILGSKLFYDDAGGSLEGYLASLETAVLGAPTQEFGLRYQLQKGVSRTKVANELLTSNLGKLSLVSPNFVAVLNRAPTRAEEGNFVALMSRGNYLRNLIASLLAGNEFYKNSTT